MSLSRAETFRRSIRDLAVLTRRDLMLLFGPVTDPRDAKRLLAVSLPSLITDYGQAAGALAADYYEQTRDDAHVTGHYRAHVAPPETGGTDVLIRWALARATDDQSFITLLMGGVQRRVANDARATIMRNALADSKARGWMRVGRGGCDFCTMLVARGAVYRTEQSAEFAAHDWCNCQYAPAFSDTQIRSVRSEFVGSAKTRNDETKAKQNAAARDWIAGHL